MDLMGYDLSVSKSRMMQGFIPNPKHKQIMLFLALFLQNFLWLSLPQKSNHSEHQNILSTCLSCVIYTITLHQYRTLQCSMTLLLFGAGDIYKRLKKMYYETDILYNMAVYVITQHKQDQVLRYQIIIITIFFYFIQPHENLHCTVTLYY